MQITIPADTVHVLREWGQLIALPLFGWAWKRTLTALKSALNEIITENVNRVRGEILAHIDEQLQVHLDSDEEQFQALREAIEENKTQ